MKRKPGEGDKTNKHIDKTWGTSPPLVGKQVGRAQAKGRTGKKKEKRTKEKEEKRKERKRPNHPGRHRKD